MFTQSDIKQIEAKGLSLKKVEQQLQYYHNGFPLVNLASAATARHGIRVVESDAAEELQQRYENLSKGRQIMKFVPASGAASRMFKHLFEFREKIQVEPDTMNAMLADEGFQSTGHFFNHLEEFAFYDDFPDQIKKSDKKGSPYYLKVLSFLLDDDGLGYSNLPKGLLKFHRYNNEPDRSSLEEHLVEAALYAKDSSGRASVHFTVSTEYLQKFVQKTEEIKNRYEQKFKLHYDIGFTVQKPSTDILAVDMNNMPFREKDGSLVFRPGGHGALIENLNDLNGDIILIKNIDNVVPDRLKPLTVVYKKALGALLLELQQEIFGMLIAIENPQISRNRLINLADYCRQELSLCFPAHFAHMDRSTQINILQRLLNRPLRVCGMVKNIGEPGGGPFWVKAKDGSLSLQIIESSQVDVNNPEQERIFRDSTHFNPVDLVCGVRNYKGERFHLPDFVDPTTGFITTKSKNGKLLKAQELPGLWNGAMANWTTIFVEVPLITFNPVKTINDLLRVEHQGN